MGKSGSPDVQKARKVGTSNDDSWGKYGRASGLFAVVQTLLIHSFPAGCLRSTTCSLAISAGRCLVRPPSCA